jgi:nucleoside-diphosphate-sugar epimerase
MILVTGGTGLVGSHLLYHLLLKNETVRAIYRATSDLNSVKNVFSYYSDDFEDVFNRIRWIEADILDLMSLEDAFEEVTHVYHCAAKVSFLPSDYQKMRRVNIEGTTNVVNLCISHQIKKLCFVSSVAAIENKKHGEVMDERDRWNNENKSGYAITKYGSEMEIWRASQEGVPVIIVNPGVILGSGYWHKGTGKLFHSVYKGLPFYTEGVTGFVDVGDVSRMLISLMESRIENERFILVAENLSFKQVLFDIADGLNRRRPRIRINKWMSEVYWRLESLRAGIILRSPLLTKHSARSVISKQFYSSTKIKKALGVDFLPMKVSVDKTCKDYKRSLTQN